jgi:hypothetical protein
MPSTVSSISSLLRAVCFLALVLRSFAGTERPTDPAFAFLHVSIVPMDYNHVLKEQTLVVRGDRITAMGPSDTTEIPPDAIRIDGANKYIIPGLADMHVHLQRDMGKSSNSWMLSLFIANGVTTVRNMWGTPDHLLLRKEIESGRLGPRIFTSGPVIDGSPPMWKASVVADTPSVARDLVISQKQEGYDFIKVYSRLKADVYDAIVATAKEQNIRVVGHTPLSVGLKGVLAARQASVEHLDGYANEVETADSPVYGKTDWYSQMIAYSFVDRAKLQRIVRETGEAGVWNCPTLVTMSKWVPPEEKRALLQSPEVAYVPTAVQESWEDLYRVQLSGFSRLDFLKLRRSDEARSQIVGALNSGGDRILAGTDTPNAFVVPGYSLHEELAKLVGAGLTPYQALSTATRNAADFLGKLDESGTVAIGKRADLVLIDGDPLVDISNANNIAGVLVRGRWLPATDLNKLLAELRNRAKETAKTVQ